MAILRGLSAKSVIRNRYLNFVTWFIAVLLIIISAFLNYFTSQIISIFVLAVKIVKLHAKTV
jgi:hypothetical protein